MTPEGRVKQAVKKLFRRYGVYYFMPVQNGMGAPGLDFHCIHHGVGFMVETKAPGNSLTPRQLATCEKIRAAQGRTFVVWDEGTVLLLELWLQAQCRQSKLCTGHAKQKQTREIVTFDK